MTTVELPLSIRLYLDALPPAAVERVLEAPPSRWCRAMFVDWDGRRCLRGHAEDWHYDPLEPWCDIEIWDPWEYGLVGEAYDSLTRDHGIEPVVRAIQDYLRARHGEGGGASGV